MTRHKLLFSAAAGLFALLLSALPLRAADGDITGVAIESNGWIADIYIASAGAANTNGTLANGLGVNNALTGSEKFQLNITSCGYDSTGATQEVSRVLYGTKLVRFPYPDQVFMDTTNESGTLKIKLALSGYVYSKDVISSAVLASGLYATNSLSSAAATWTTVTNSSAQGYFKSIAKWTLPGLQRITSTSMSPRIIGAAGEASGGQPLACVRMWAQDDAGHSNVVTVSSMTISQMTGDYFGFPEYIGNLSLANLDTGTNFTLHAQAFPRIGDSSSVLSTLDFADQPYSNPYFSPRKYWYDPSSTFVPFVAVVDYANGSDTAGRADTDYTVASTVPCQTISNAFLRILQSNTTYRAVGDCRGGIAYLTNGTHTNWVTVKGTNNPFWAEIRPYPGKTSNDVTITTRAAMTGALVPNLKIQDCTISGSDVYFLYSNTNLWYDRCWVALTGNPGTALCNTYWTGCRVVQGKMNTYSGGTNGFAILIRGCNLTDNPNGMNTYCVVGNYKGKTTMALGALDPGFGSGPYNDGWVIAYNKIYGHTAAGASLVVDITLANSVTNGFAVLGNIFEMTSATSPSASVTAYGNNPTPAVTNAIIFNNTSLGAKNNWAYDWGSSDPGLLWRVGYFVKNNFISSLSVKDDNFTPFSGARIGNWSARHGVAWSGNFIGNDIPLEYPTFTGINARQVTDDQLSSYYAFVDFQAGYAYPSYSVGTGGGDYHTQSTSPLRGLGVDVVLPYDLDGNPRFAGDAAGAFGYAVASSQTVRQWQVPVRRVLRK